MNHHHPEAPLPPQGQKGMGATRIAAASCLLCLHNPQPTRFGQLPDCSGNCPPSASRNTGTVVCGVGAPVFLALPGHAAAVAFPRGPRCAPYIATPTRPAKRGTGAAQASISDR